jgi:hypothetical protein
MYSRRPADIITLSITIVPEVGSATSRQLTAFCHEPQRLHLALPTSLAS